MAEIQRAINLATEFVRGGRVIIDGLDGPVVVEGWERDEVSLAATKRVNAGSEADAERALADMETAFRRSGNELTISVTGNRGRYGYGETWVDCYIRIPAESDLYVDTSAGSVDVRGVTGRIRLDTGSGSATLRQCGGDIVVDTGSGAVVAEEINGDLNIDVGGGSITVTGVSGTLYADSGGGEVNIKRVGGKLTVDGGNSVHVADTASDIVIEAGDSVRATGCRGGFAHIDAGNRVEAEFAVRPGGRYTIEAGGEARVSVPAAANLEIKGEAASFKYELPLKIQRLEDGEFEATLNGRGARLNIDCGGRFILLESGLAPETAAEPAAEPAAEAAPATGGAPVDEAGLEFHTIIQMVADRKITPEEADELLKALGRPSDA
ncbi:MAG: hypothetical protein ACM3XN_10395 [Chloroflexota bacterium]